MIDIHAHVLPFVDDGSKSIEDSIAMIEQSATLGITDIILTPHYRGNYVATPQQLNKQFEVFKKAVQEKGISVNLYLGQEIYVDSEMLSDLENNKVITLNNSKYLLIEPEYNACDITEYVYDLVIKGYVPIVAHVERFKYISIEEVCEIKRLGGLIQVNASAFFGKEFNTDKRIVKKLLKQGLVDFVASDVHYNRKNYMQMAYEYVSKKFGEKTAEKIFKTNAEVILRAN